MSNVEPLVDLPAGDRLTPRVPSWTLSEASALVADLNAALRPFDLHVALGGGVINRGYSNKDIDLYVLPVYIKQHTFMWAAVDQILAHKLGGEPESMRAGSASEHDEGRCFLAERIYIMDDGRRVDLFVVDPR